MARFIQLVFGLLFLGLVLGVIILAVAPTPITPQEETKIIPAERFEG